MLIIIGLFYIIVKRELGAIWDGVFRLFALQKSRKAPSLNGTKWFLHSLPYSCYTITKHISYESKVCITIYFLITFQKSMLLYQSHIKAGGE